MGDHVSRDFTGRQFLPGEKTTWEPSSYSSVTHLFAELEQAFPKVQGLYYRLLQLRYLRFLQRIEIGKTSKGDPYYAWTLTREYAEKVWR